MCVFDSKFTILIKIGFLLFLDGVDTKMWDVKTKFMIGVNSKGDNGKEMYFNLKESTMHSF